MDDSAPVIRELTSADWQALREIRLHALRTEPGLFFSSYADEAEDDDAAWIARAAGDDAHQIFGAFAGARLIGISGVRADSSDTAGLGLSYVLPEFRGRGLGARFFAARLAWVRARPQFARAAVGHRRSNAASRKNILRAGFVWTHDEPHDWPDGSREDDVCYELFLRGAVTGEPRAATGG
jgi:RimJ/RimL family protein N-acetyltransferase